MKKLIILVLALASGYSALAQQKGKTDHMSISIYEQGGRISYMVITRTDSAQVKKDLKIKLHVSSTKTLLADQDAALMQLLKPYYNNGWKLITFGIDNSVFNGNDYSETFKYYLSKDE